MLPDLCVQMTCWRGSTCQMPRADRIVVERACQELWNLCSQTCKWKENLRSTFNVIFKTTCLRVQAELLWEIYICMYNIVHDCSIL